MKFQIFLLIVLSAFLMAGCGKEEPKIYKILVLDDATSRSINGAQIMDVAHEHLYDVTKNYPPGIAYYTGLPGQQFVVTNPDYLEKTMVLPKENDQSIVVRLNKPNGTIHVHSQDLFLYFDVRDMNGQVWPGECSPSQPVDLNLPLNTLLQVTVKVGYNYPTQLFMLQEPADVLNVIVHTKNVDEDYILDNTLAGARQRLEDDPSSQETFVGPQTVCRVDFIPLNRKVNKPLRDEFLLAQ